MQYERCWILIEGYRIVLDHNRLQPYVPHFCVLNKSSGALDHLRSPVQPDNLSQKSSNQKISEINHHKITKDGVRMGTAQGDMLLAICRAKKVSR